jgi:hypothetical protein
MLIGKIWLLLGFYRMAISVFSLKWLTRRLKHSPRPVPPVALATVLEEEACRIGAQVAAISRYTPWQSACLAQVLVVQRLLSRRGISGQFFLGVQKGEAHDVEPLSAHAWLQCGHQMVNGGDGSQFYVILSSYSWDCS